jgi:hypothetical protein
VTTTEAIVSIHVGPYRIVFSTREDFITMHLGIDLDSDFALPGIVSLELGIEWHDCAADDLSQWRGAFDELRGGSLVVPVSEASGAILFFSEVCRILRSIVLRQRFTTALRKRARRGFSGYPIETMAFYGLDDKLATTVAVGIVLTQGQEPAFLERWLSDVVDVRNNHDINEEIACSLAAQGRGRDADHDRLHETKPVG